MRHLTIRVGCYMDTLEEHEEVEFHQLPKVLANEARCSTEIH